MLKLKIALCFLGLVLAIAGISCADTSHTNMALVRETCEDAGLGGWGNNTTGTSGGQGGTGGADLAPECTADTAEKDCAHLGVPNPQCGNVQCIENKCALQITQGPIASQKYGDCRQVLCDALGNLIEVDDDADFYNDGNQCTLDFCLNGAAHFTLPDGNQCPESGEGYCYQGKCAECVDILPQATCKGAGMVCDQLFCEPFGPECMAQCGGICAPCMIGQACLEHADCLSNVCANGMCQFPTCTDGVKNDGETGVDCGAPSCALCPAGEGCEAPSNCASGVCVLGICQDPTCTDGTLNSDETGVDCGGSNCAPCVEP